MNLRSAVDRVVGAGLPAIATVASRASPLLRRSRGVHVKDERNRRRKPKYAWGLTGEDERSTEECQPSSLLGCPACIFISLTSPSPLRAAPGYWLHG